jgi:hypothetical protein
MATIKCDTACDFAVLDKHDFHKIIGKIEKKKLNKKIDFLKNIPCFSKWTTNSIGKFSYFLKK